MELWFRSCFGFGMYCFGAATSFRLRVVKKGPVQVFEKDYRVDTAAGRCALERPFRVSGAGTNADKGMASK